MSEPRRYADGDGGEILEYRAVPRDEQKERPLQVGDRVKVVRVLGNTPSDDWARGFVGQEGAVQSIDTATSNTVEVAIGYKRLKFALSEVDYIPEESLDEKLDRIDPPPNATAYGICEDDWKAGWVHAHQPEWTPERIQGLRNALSTPRRRALMEAADIVDNERNHEYGEPKDNLGRTAALVQVLFPERQWTPADIALFMVMVKAARLVHTRGHDTGIDLLGWGALYLELEES